MLCAVFLAISGINKPSQFWWKAFVALSTVVMIQRASPLTMETAFKPTKPLEGSPI
jgi:hypothetical protein